MKNKRLVVRTLALPLAVTLAACGGGGGGGGGTSQVRPTPEPEPIVTTGKAMSQTVDYVFDGSKDGAYVETDPVNPQSVYGKSKLAGEQAIAAAGCPALVLRTCWVAGAHGGNFAKTMLRLGRERDSLRVIADQFGAPTTASLIADVTAQIVARHWLHGDRRTFASGVYHLAAAGETTWHAYATEVLRYATAQGIELKAVPSRIEAIPATAYPLPAPRPANSRLDTGKLRQTFGIHLPDWQQGVHHLLDQIFS